MDFLLIVLIALSVCCIRTNKNVLYGINTQDTLTQRNFLSLRAFCCIGVVCHHIAQEFISGGFLFIYFKHLGVYFTAIFFAISGFALFKQYKNKGDAYLNGFLKKRLTALLLPFIFIFVVYLVFFLIYDLINSINFFIDIKNRILITFTQGNTFVKYSWYVEVVLFLYILFFVSFKIFQKNDICKFFCIFCGMIFLTILCRFVFKYNSYWYKSVFSFLIGMIYSFLLYSKTISFKKNLIVLIFTVILLAVFGVITTTNINKNIILVLELITVNIIFPIAVFSLYNIFNFNSKILGYLGARSYEIYISQGIGLMIAEKIHSNIKNNDLTNIVIFVIIFTVTLLISEITYKICNLLRKTRKKTNNT